MGWGNEPAGSFTTGRNCDGCVPGCFDMTDPDGDMIPSLACDERLLLVTLDAYVLLTA